jgi:hypothetical protein
MKLKISHWQQIALLATAISTGMGSMAWGQELYQTHSDGSIWEYTGKPCKGATCPGWLEMDNNPNLWMIAAGGGALYEMHKDGSIWWYVGPACSGGSCPGWVELDNNPVAVAIGAGPSSLYEVHADGSIWAWNGVICNGGLCPGWTLLYAPGTIGAPYYAANANVLVADDGNMGVFQYNGTPFDWSQILGYNAYSIAVDGAGGIYTLDGQGTISVLGILGWETLSQDKATKNMAAGGTPTLNTLFKQQKDHSIWQFAGVCGSSCPWQEIDNHKTSGPPVAGSNTVYQIRTAPTASIWQYNGTPCDGTVCSGWVKLDDNPTTNTIVAGPQQF